MGNHPGSADRPVAATPDGATETPRRVQLSRAKGWRMPENTVKVDRSTRFGNPFRAGDHLGAKRAVWLFRLLLAPERHQGIPPQEVHWYAARGEKIRRHLHFLRGKNLACWCKPDDPCHADVLLELANAEPTDAAKPSPLPTEEDGPGKTSSCQSTGEIP